MEITRRQFLTLTGLGTAVAALSACSSPREALLGRREIGAWPAATQAGLWRGLSRLTFGPRPEEQARAAEIGLRAWVEEQLAPGGIDDWDAELRVSRFDSLLMDTSTIYDVRENDLRRDLQSAAVLRAVYSRRQLHEVMVEFWSDHFNVSVLKEGCAWLKVVDDREVIRPHALGSFPELLWASMHSPAMLVYLDNQENFAGAPNENYARELLELHTLGVGAGYTQRDVEEVARCLTGWTVDDRLFRGQFRFAANRHDDREKRVLGHVITAGGGERDGERVFELVLTHPATPRFIAGKLARRLVADDPPDRLVEAAAETFRRTNGDIKAILKTILFSPEFAAAPPKLKRPFDLLAGALRQLDAESNAGRPILDMLAKMGQPPFHWPMPDGYPDRADAWSGNLLPRWQFALQFATGGLAGTRIALPKLLKASAATTMEAAIERFGALLLGAPPPRAAITALLAALGGDLDEERLRALLAILVASPQYQWR